MKRTWITAVLLTAVTSLAGCVMEEPGDKLDYDNTKGVDGLGKAEAWGPSDAPSIFNSNLEFRLAQLPQVGQATRIPWASSYWPYYEDSINYPWAGASTDPASVKYAKAFGKNPTDTMRSVSQAFGIESASSRKSCTQDSDCTSLKDGSACAKRTGQTSGRCIPTWWGICPAWSAAAVLNAEPHNAVTLNGVRFEPNDIRALLSFVHNRVPTKFVSLRCEQDTPGDDAGIPSMILDIYGRPTGASASCADTNAGTYHVILTNYLGKMSQSFVEDRTQDYEVWNQPMRGYNIRDQHEVTAQQANGLLGVTTGGTTVTRTANLAQGAWSTVWDFAVTPGGAVKVAMTGTGDADLYVRFGSAPTASAYDCRPYTDGSAETCEVTAPAGASKVYVSVNGYSASNVSLNITSGGTVPSQYQFNSAAAKLFYVKNDVKWIGEASSSTSGPTSATIDQYTHIDTYEYILELDAAGKIIGGEWVGSSKLAHPDFVWLPMPVTNTSLIEGSIKYSDVMQLLQMSNGTTPGGGGTGTPRVITDAASVAKGAWKNYGPYNVAAGSTFTAAMTGTSGDADLYVSKDAAPTLTAYACRPYQDGSNESCSIVGPATVYVGVNGYQDANPFSINISYTEGGGTVTPPNPPTFAHLNTSGSVALGEMKVVQLPMPAGKQIVVRTTSSVDVDLYLLWNGAPTTSSYAARGYTSSGNENVTFRATENGTLFIGVHGYAAGSYTLRTTDN